MVPVVGTAVRGSAVGVRPSSVCHTVDCDGVGDDVLSERPPNGGRNTSGSVRKDVQGSGYRRHSVVHVTRDRTVVKSLVRLSRDSSVLGWIAQVSVLVLVVVFFATIASVAMENWRRSGSTMDWAWLSGEFKTQLGEGFDTHPDTAGRALLVGIVNTMRVTVAAIAAATVVGFAVGVGRLSDNWIVRRASTVYVEVFRNIPVLLQMFFWEALIISLPSLVPDTIGRYVFKASNKGIGVAWPRVAAGFWLWFAAVVVIAVVVIRRRGADPAARMRLPWLVGAVTAAAVGWWVLDAVVGPLLSFEMASVVTRGRFTQWGTSGMVMTESFFAVWFGLTIYAAAFIAEIVRGGILAVHRGQREAAAALGMSRLASLRFVVIPQAMRIILPPLGNQYLNVLKYSALGVAVAYPEILKVGFSIINQTGEDRAVVLIWIAFFLSFSLAISAVVNYYNRKFGLVGARVRALESR
jgi:general L-amino acid transport system permease protein